MIAPSRGGGRTCQCTVKILSAACHGPWPRRARHRHAATCPSLAGRCPGAVRVRTLTPGNGWARGFRTSLFGIAGDVSPRADGRGRRPERPLSSSVRYSTEGSQQPQQDLHQPDLQLPLDRVATEEAELEQQQQGQELELERELEQQEHAMEQQDQRQRELHSLSPMMQEDTERLEQEVFDLEQEKDIVNRLFYSVSVGNLQRAEDLWLQNQDWLIAKWQRSIKVGKAGKIMIPRHGPGRQGATVPLSQIRPAYLEPAGPNAFDSFLSAFMSLRGPDRAVKVWNRMVSAGIQPTRFTWNAMLYGCRRVWDIDGMEEIWRRMLATGFEPDVTCWTTRIHTLTTRGQWQDGVRALREMARAWQAAAKAHLQTQGLALDKVDLSRIESVHGVAKPNNITINAVLSGLLRKERPKEAQMVLQWAGTLGIRPDTACYNTILDYAIRVSDPQYAAKVFQLMERSGVQSDEYTFSTLFESFFRDLDTQAGSPAEQTQRVMNLLREIEGRDMRVTHHVYGVLIYHLLKGAGNVEGAYRVLEALIRRGKAPNHYINLMFLQHFMAQRPPDIEAIDALWERIDRNGFNMDTLLYDYFVQAYAMTDQLERMRALLERMRNESKAPNWNILIQVLNALARARAWDEASAFVADVARQEGLCRDGIRGSAVSWLPNKFWLLVQELTYLGLNQPSQQRYSPIMASTFASRGRPTEGALGPSLN